LLTSVEAALNWSVSESRVTSIRCVCASRFWNTKQLVCYVRFEVITAVTTKNVVFWDVTQCGSLYCGLVASYG
jgi:hypothetical protein